MSIIIALMHVDRYFCHVSCLNDVVCILLHLLRDFRTHLCIERCTSTKKNLKHISIIKILLTLVTKRSFPSTFTMTITINTPSMIVTAGNFTFVRRYVTFGSLPTFLTMTNAATIMTVRGTKYWTYAYDIVVAIYGFIIFFCVFGE